MRPDHRLILGGYVLAVATLDVQAGVRGTPRSAHADLLALILALRCPKRTDDGLTPRLQAVCQGRISSLLATGDDRRRDMHFVFELIRVPGSRKAVDRDAGLRRSCPSALPLQGRCLQSRPVQTSQARSRTRRRSCSASARRDRLMSAAVACPSVLGRLRAASERPPTSPSRRCCPTDDARIRRRRHPLIIATPVLAPVTRRHAHLPILLLSRTGHPSAHRPCSGVRIPRCRTSQAAGDLLRVTLRRDRRDRPAGDPRGKLLDHRPAAGKAGDGPGARGSRRLPGSCPDVTSWADASTHDLPGWADQHHDQQSATSHEARACSPSASAEICTTRCSTAAAPPHLQRV